MQLTRFIFAFGFYSVVEGEIDPKLTGTAVSTPPVICEL
jgi:hypothetical protein